MGMGREWKGGAPVVLAVVLAVGVVVEVVVVGDLGDLSDWAISGLTVVWRMEWEETVRRANMVVGVAMGVVLVGVGFGVSGAVGWSCCCFDLDGDLREGKRDVHYEQRRRVGKCRIVER
jgi:hypothetical protein